jgi:hypothetical protein
MQVMGVTEQDLHANAGGTLGPGQRTMVRKMALRGMMIGTFMAVGGLAACVLMVVVDEALHPPIELSLMLPLHFLIPGLFLFASVVGIRNLVRSVVDLSGGAKVRAVEGVVTVEVHAGRAGADAGTTTFHLHVGDTEFEVKHLYSAGVFQVIARGHPHRVYYTVPGRTVVGLEPLPAGHRG